ncbi:MAG: hypothetical protein GY895_19255 [Phycisphaera sp.]|nr:hypothetical protein [Phycisphaera sp.]
MKRSIACWARDQRSFEILKDLLGDEFDPERHHVGVDMAFGLSPRKPKLIPDLFKSRDEAGNRCALVGLNVSGLMYNDPEAAKSRYGFVADYSRLIDGFIDWLLRETDSDLVLVPHVMAPPPSKESDVYACENVMERLGDRASGRVRITPTEFGANEVKWIISKCDWFCGTRMHATIAGLSTCTPTSTVSYSDKALGVFETCGQGREVFDPRKMDTETVIAAMIDSYKRRSEIRESLEANIPGVKAIAEKQMDDICEVIRECGDERRSRRSA